MDKGYCFSFEALLALIVLIGLGFYFLGSIKKDEGIDRIYVVQLEHDLLKVWIKEKNFNEGEMRKDLEKAFPQIKAEIKIGGKAIKINENNGFKEAISASAFFVDKENKVQEIKLTVFY